MRISMLLFLFVACSIAYGGDTDSAAHVKQIRKIDDIRDAPIESIGLWNEVERKILIEKLLIRGSWRWSFDEWIRLLFYFDTPEHDDDDEYGSNGGWSIA